MCVCVCVCVCVCMCVFIVYTASGLCWQSDKEFCDGGAVTDIFKYTDDPLTEAQIATVVSETLKGLVYLHDNSIIHRDIKGDNVLLTSRGEVSTIQQTSFLMHSFSERIVFIPAFLPTYFESFGSHLPTLSLSFGCFIFHFWWKKEATFIFGLFLVFFFFFGRGIQLFLPKYVQLFLLLLWDSMSFSIIVLHLLKIASSFCLHWMETSDFSSCMVLVLSE